MPARLIATSFALISFACAVVVGAVADNAAGVIIWRAILTMIVCYFIGSVVGSFAQRILDKHIAAYKHANPFPENVSVTDVMSDSQYDDDPQLEGAVATESQATAASADSEESSVNSQNPAAMVGG